MSKAVPWDDILRDPDLRILFDQYIATRDEFSLGVFAERLCDSADASLQAYGLHISREIQLSHEFPCGHQPPWHECRCCMLQEESYHFYNRYGFYTWMPRERLVPRVPWDLVRNGAYAYYEQFDFKYDGTYVEGQMPRMPRHSWIKDQIRTTWIHHLGVPAEIRCTGQDLVSLWPWLQKNVCLRKVELTALPPIGIEYDNGGQFIACVVGIQGCFCTISERATRLYGELGGGPSDIEIVEACFHNAAPWLEVEIPSRLLSGGEAWTIMDLVATRPIVQRSLQYVPISVDLGHERLYAQYL